MSEGTRKPSSEQERQATRDELAAYAREVAGTVDDLDPVLEQAGLESLSLYEEKRAVSILRKEKTPWHFFCQKRIPSLPADDVAGTQKRQIEIGLMGFSCSKNDLGMCQNNVQVIGWDLPDSFLQRVELFWSRWQVAAPLAHCFQRHLVDAEQRVLSRGAARLRRGAVHGEHFDAARRWRSALRHGLVSGARGRQGERTP